MRRWFFALKDRWLSALLMIAVVCGAVGWVLARQAPVYATTATLLVERSNDRVVDIKAVVDNTVDSSLSDALLLTHIQQMRSYTFIARALLSFTPAEREALLAPYSTKKPLASWAPEKALPDDDSRILDIVNKGLRVERLPRTLLIGLTMRHRDPAMAKVVANRLAEQYREYLEQRSSASNDSALIFLNKEAEELRRKVEQSEHDVQAYRERNNLIFLEQNQNIVVERVRALSSALTQARVERLSLDARLAQVEAVLKDQEIPRELISLPEFAGFAAVQRQLDENRANHDVLAKRYGPLHPRMQDNLSLLQTLEKQRREQLISALANLRNQQSKATTQEQQIGNELAAAERESLRLDQLTVEYNVLQRVVATTRDTYAQILARRNETTITSRLPNTNVKFFDPAGQPVIPVEPNPLTIFLVLSALAGVIIVGYPLAADMLDSRIRSSTDVESYLGAELAGLLPSSKKIPAKERAWIVHRVLDEDAVESFRGLYSHIQFSARSKPPGTILITSTIPGEGKSFVACNLAAAFANHGHRTLLIDADFRRPTLHRAFGLENQLGLLAYLHSPPQPDEKETLSSKLGIVQILPGLSLIRSGGESRQVTELLGRPRMISLMADLQARFDVIIVDASPAGVFPDSDACIGFSQELLYVCRFKASDREHVRHTMDRLRQREIHFLGVALNGVPGGTTGEYYLSGRARGRRHYQEYYHKTAG